jgi:hypothetical protein
MALVIEAAAAACVQRLPAGETLALRAGPGTEHAIVHSIPAQSCRVAVDTQSCSNNWCRASYDGKFGWVSSRHLEDFRAGENTDFNFHVLKAVYESVGKRQGRGYDLRRNYSQDMAYGPDASGVKRFFYDNQQKRFVYPGAAGETMCVAAVAEVLVEALNDYFADTKDNAPFAKLSKDHWGAGARASHLRQHLWEYEGLGSKGAAHALERFNIGKQGKFSEMKPGDLFKLNRTSGPGHSTIFIAYLGRSGNVLERFSDDVKGVLYFSAQESAGRDLYGKPSNGLGFRREYFNGNCPNDDVRNRRHCHVFPVGSAYEPNVGWMLHPAAWGEVGRRYRDEVASRVYLERSGQPIPASPELAKKLIAEIEAEVAKEIDRELDPDQIGSFEGP